MKARTTIAILALFAIAFASCSKLDLKKDKEKGDKKFETYVAIEHEVSGIEILGVPAADIHKLHAYFWDEEGQHRYKLVGTMSVNTKDVAYHVGNTAFHDMAVSFSPEGDNGYEGRFEADKKFLIIDFANGDGTVPIKFKHWQK